MYKYLRKMMDAADTIGGVDDFYMLDWGKNEKRLSLKGKTEDGKSFALELTMEVAEDGD